MSSIQKLKKSFKIRFVERQKRKKKMEKRKKFVSSKKFIFVVISLYVTLILRLKMYVRTFQGMEHWAGWTQDRQFQIISSTVLRASGTARSNGTGTNATPGIRTYCPRKFVQND